MAGPRRVQVSSKLKAMKFMQRKQPKVSSKAQSQRMTGLGVLMCVEEEIHRRREILAKASGEKRVFVQKDVTASCILVGADTVTRRTFKSFNPRLERALRSDTAAAENDDTFTKEEMAKVFRKRGKKSARK